MAFDGIALADTLKSRKLSDIWAKSASKRIRTLASAVHLISHKAFYEIYQFVSQSL